MSGKCRWAQLELNAALEMADAADAAAAAATAAAAADDADARRLLHLGGSGRGSGSYTLM
jgi:hypothetical protein